LAIGGARKPEIRVCMNKQWLAHVRYVLTGKHNRWHFEQSERADFLRRALMALSFNGIEGDYAEFGSHGGVTFGLAHRYGRELEHARHQWAFDSFQGLPETDREEDQHPYWVPGTLSMPQRAFVDECRRKGIPDAGMTVVAGFYDDTIGRADYAGPLPADIALAYIDCDLFSSTATVLEFLRSRLKHGMIVAFDDYFCFDAERLSGERAAMLAYLKTDDRFHWLAYQPFGWHGMSFILESREQVERYN
jgi:O-methyltransferase